MVDINILKHIFGDDNVVVISSPEEVEKKMKDIFEKVQPKEEHQSCDCRKCNMPQNLCFAKSENRERFKSFAVDKAANSIARILGGEGFVSSFFTTATVLKYTNPDPEVSGLKPTLLAALDKIKEGDEKAVAEVILDLVLLYFWCNK